MKTKRVELFVDLYPGWQDNVPHAVYAHTRPASEKAAGSLRVKITAELPCHGGSADVDLSVTSTTQIVPEGLQGS